MKRSEREALLIKITQSLCWMLDDIDNLKYEPKESKEYLKSKVWSILEWHDEL